MHPVNQVPVAVIHFMEGLVAQDAGVVDHHVDPAEDIQGVLYDLVAVGDGVMVGFGNAARRADLRHHPVGRRGVGALALG